MSTKLVRCMQNKREQQGSTKRTSHPKSRKFALSFEIKSKQVCGSFPLFCCDELVFSPHSNTATLHPTLLHGGQVRRGDVVEGKSEQANQDRHEAAIHAFFHLLADNHQNSTTPKETEKTVNTSTPTSRGKRVRGGYAQQAIKKPLSGVPKVKMCVESCTPQESIV
jgi:hypothetical protein